MFEKNMGEPVTASAIAKVGQDYLLVLGFESGNLEVHMLEFMKNESTTLTLLGRVNPQYKHNMQVNRIKILSCLG